MKIWRVRRWQVAACVLLLAAQAAWPQTADEIEALLASPGVTYAQAARFVLEAADAAVFADPAQAFRFAHEHGWLPKRAAEHAPARLDGISLLVMRSFNMPGGLFYTVFKNPHYAYRELTYREIIQERTEPEMAVSGDLLLFMVGRILSRTQDDIQAHTEAVARSQPAPAPAPEYQDSLAVQRLEQLEARLLQMEAEAQEINARLAAQAIANTTAQVTDAGIMVSLSNIQFLAESAVLADSERAKIQQIAAILRDIPGRRIRVAGHTALAGNAESQLQLSYDRAQAVAVLLVSMGARDAENVIIQGYGGSRPVADNSTPQGMAANRRVELTILED